ncbi:MAG: glycosyltransferase [Thauera propionica]|jgi:GT2 family glycosyltransferase/glycosyltransferase involved in cell wall biosynthesis|nr:glycosyltransferase [Thauera propionica]
MNDDSLPERLVGAEDANPGRIDVIVPVYRGFDATCRCLNSVLSAPVLTPFELIVVDDASPEAGLSEWLEGEAEAGQFTLVRNPVNVGFVGSVNRGMALHPERDVVLLNSDTEVANDWLDRIMRCARGDPRIATVTPFSNNGTICSYPFDGWHGQVPGVLGLAGLDAIFARALAGRVVDLPTAVGFCMFIRRACMDEVGAFDEQAFGRGYGEENDFSLRAAKAGWRNVLCADTFVFHQGSVSFGGERTELAPKAAAALLSLHPDYDQRVGAFLADDPLRGLRAAVDLARVALEGDEAEAVFSERRLEWRMRHPASRVPLPDGVDAGPVILHVCHNWGGGTLRWIEDFAGARRDCRHLLIRMGARGNALGAFVELAEVGGACLMRWSLTRPIETTATAHPEYARILGAIVDGFGVAQVIVSSLVGHSLDVFDTGRPTLVVMHDFHPFCPAMFAWFDGPCVSCNEGRLADCLERNPHNVLRGACEPVQRLALRQAYGRCLARETVEIAAPSRSFHTRYALLFPVLRDKRWHLIPHGIDAALRPGPSCRPVLPRPRERWLRLIIPGRLLPHKGVDLLLAIADELSEFADVLLLGAGEGGAAFAQRPNVQIIDHYEREDLAKHVDVFGADVALLLSTVAESFSYTLSEMWALGLPVVATRLGAFEERIEHGETGLLADREPRAILACLRRLVDERGLLERMAANVRDLPVRTVEEMVRDYDALLFRDPIDVRRTCTNGIVWALWHALGDRKGGQRPDPSMLLLEQELAEQRALVEAMRGSTSWRVTRPLRFLKRFVAGVWRWWR